MYCGNCGKKLDKGVAFCPECGAKIADGQKSKVPINSKNPIKAPKLPMAVAAICFIAVIIVGVLVYQWYMSAEQRAIRAINEGDYNLVMAILNEDDTIFESEKLAERICANIADVKASYIDDEIDYNSAIRELDKIDQLTVSGIAATLREAKLFVETLNQSRINFATAETLYLSGDYIQAIDYYSLVVDEDTNYFTALDKITQAEDRYRSEILSTAAEFASDGLYEDAITALENAIENLNNDPELVLQLQTYQKTYEDMFTTIYVKTGMTYYFADQIEGVPDTYYEYKYDSYGRLLSETFYYVNYSWYLDSGFTSYEEHTEEVTYTYDEHGFRSSAIVYLDQKEIGRGSVVGDKFVVKIEYPSEDEPSVASYTFDNSLNLIETVNETSNIRQVSTFDDEGKMLTHSINWQNGPVTLYEYQYDANGFVKEIVNHSIYEDNDTITYQRVAEYENGRPTKLVTYDSDGNARSEQVIYVYDDLGNLIEQSTYRDGSLEYSYTYLYEAVKVHANSENHQNSQKGLTT